MDIVVKKEEKVGFAIYGDGMFQITDEPGLLNEALEALREAAQALEKWIVTRAAIR